MKVWLVSMDGDPDREGLDLRVFADFEKAMESASHYRNSPLEWFHDPSGRDEHRFLPWANHRFNGNVPKDLIFIYEVKSYSTPTGDRVDYHEIKGCVWSIEVE